MSIQDYWYKTAAETPIWLKALSFIFRSIAWIRRVFYRFSILKLFRPSIPVIVVGNINVGGTGKTPFVIWLARLLKQAGYHPGIVSRGYGGQASSWPQQVRADSDPLIVGDEALLIARHTGCPMAVGPNRRSAARQLFKHKKVDIIISDDGLQHYALARDIEFAVIDGQRRFGNGYCLPAGPLREPVSRLRRVDFIICNGGEARDGEHLMKLRMKKATNVVDRTKKRRLDDFKGQSVHAVAGIGNPQRFFGQLAKAEIQTENHAFADHYAFSPEDFQFSDDREVLMTEKDAVKCERFGNPRLWFVDVEAELDPKLAAEVLALVERFSGGPSRRSFAPGDTVSTATAEHPSPERESEFARQQVSA